MPTLTTFYGITIRMYFAQAEHPPIHIHASYGEHEASIAVNNGAVIDGSLPPRALSMVREWLLEHRAEIEEMWETQDFKRLPPLK